MDRQNASRPFDICIESPIYPQRGLVKWQQCKPMPDHGRTGKWKWAIPAGLVIALCGMMILWGSKPLDAVARITSKMKTPPAPLSTHQEEADAGLILLDIQTKQDAAAFHVTEPGIYVLSVSRGSPAHKAGIQPGDCILQLNDKPVEDATKLLSFLNHLANGETASIVLRRGPDLMTVLFRTDATDEHA